MSKIDEVILKDGKLFDMVVDNMEVFVTKDHVRCLVMKSNEQGEQWGILKTDLGKSYLIERCDFLRWRLQDLIDDIKKPTD